MLYIIVPVYNRLSKTIEFINSLKLQNYNNYKLVIANDASTDNTKEFLTVNYPEIIVLDGDGSLFWGGGINLGLSYVEKVALNTDYVAFANNDVVFEKDTIELLLNQADKYRDLALFHSLVINNSGLCFTSGSKIFSWPLFWTIHPFRNKIPESCRNQKLCRIDFSTGRFLLFKKEVLNFVPRINTRDFIHYLGDCDFSMRLKKKGIPTYIVPDSWCRVDNSTTGENPGHVKNFRHFIRTLTSIKSGNNLPLRYKFGWRHCPKIYFPFYCLAVTLQVLILNVIKN